MCGTTTPQAIYQALGRFIPAVIDWCASIGHVGSWDLVEQGMILEDLSYNWTKALELFELLVSYFLVYAIFELGKTIFLRKLIFLVLLYYFFLLSILYGQVVLQDWVPILPTSSISAPNCMIVTIFSCCFCLFPILLRILVILLAITLLASGWQSLLLS